jgi:tetratricopeptide (TPR) repeat protein
LSLYIEFLFKQAEASAADETTNGNVGDENLDIAEQKQIFLSEVEARLSELARLKSAGNENLEALLVAYQGRLLRARGRESDAKAHIAEFAARRADLGQGKETLAQRCLTIGELYSSIGAHAEAENWYRRLIELKPNRYVPLVQSLLAQEKRQEAIELCLRISNHKPNAEMAALIANLMTVADRPLEDAPAARAAIEAAIEKYDENIQLLHAEAVRLASCGQYDEAIALFRKILSIAPNNFLALNNFATVLAENPDQRGEALEHIQRAIEIAGRKPSLLDTQGTILLKIGNTERAIACLEEATAGGTVDARYHLHLAAAYQQAKRYEDAQSMLMEARAFGLEKFVLTADDRELLAALDKSNKGIGSVAPLFDTKL